MNNHRLRPIAVGRISFSTRIIIDLEASVLEISEQSLVLVEEVVNRLAQRTLR